MNISIKTIPHSKQRYNTVGDYWENGDTWQFRISKMKDDYEFLVVIHELIEAYLTKKRDIKWKDIDKFDKEWLKMKDIGDIEPGNNNKAPYYKEHRFAENIERLIAHELSIDWFKYEREIL